MDKCLVKVSNKVPQVRGTMMMVMVNGCCLGPLGKTSLFEEPPKPGFQVRTDLEPKVDPAKVKAEMHY